MVIADRPGEEQLRRSYKYFNYFMLMLWRLGLGPWLNSPELTGRIMVINHAGRKTGLTRRTPVNYAIVDGQVYCTAGFGAASDWYQNIMANPQVELWLPQGWWAGVARDITGSPGWVALLRRVLIASGFAARMVVIDPIHMSDEQLVEASGGYRLVHVRRTEARTGPGGPGDLAWIWPLATMILLPLCLFRRRSP